MLLFVMFIIAFNNHYHYHYFQYLYLPSKTLFCSLIQQATSMNLNVEKQQWFNHIYQDYQSSLVLWFKHKLHNHHSSEDLSQEVFYRALKSNYRFEEIKEPKAWLLGIAKHVIIDHWRHQQIERGYLETLPSITQDDYPSTEHQICMCETLNQVQQTLEKLPNRVAQVFLLSQLEGMTYRTIGQQLNISQATVKRDMKQAFSACSKTYNNTLN